MGALDYTLVGAVVAAVIGAAKGIEVYARRRAETQQEQDARALAISPGTNPNTTGELSRPVTQDACNRTRGELTTKLDALDDRFDVLNVTLIRLEGKFDAFAAAAPGNMHSVARKEVDAHERKVHPIGGGYRRSPSRNSDGT